MPRSPRPRRSASATVRFDLAGSRRPRTAADPRPDAGAGRSTRSIRDTFEDTTFEPIVGSGPYVVAKVDAGQERHAQAQSRTIGAATCRSIAASGISTRSASTTTATPIRISRRSRTASSTCAPRTIPAAGRPPTTFPRVRDGRVVKEAFTYGLPKTDLRLRLQHPPADLRRHPRARGDRAAVRLRMDQPQLSSSISTGASRATSRAPNCRRAAGRRTRASARCWRRFPTRCAPTCWTAPGRRRSADGSGRDRDTLRARARAARRRRLRAARHRCCVERATRQAAHLRDPGHHPRRGAARARLLARPQARRHRGAGAPGRRGAIRAAATSPSIST